MDRLKKILSRFGLDGFLFAIIVMITLAYFFPGPGILQKPISIEALANYGVTGVFFFYGLKLNREKLKKGLANWRMHVLVQLTTFIVFPLLALAIKPCFVTENAGHLWLGIFFLAALPSTVSSSVVMVSIANGNIPAAIFNASISALIGVFITPLWVGIFMSADTGTFDATGIVMKLTLQVLVPVIAGMLLNKRFGGLTETYKKQLRGFDQTIILMIIYTSFCKSFTLHLFDSMSMLEIILLAAGMLGLFLAVLLFVKLVARLLHFNRGDTITVMFCGSKKSLVHGTVMAGILFAGSSLTGFILLPLMLYHALQIVAASFLAKRMAQQEQLTT
jgi:sodium/bile acid cotransporter 7